MEKTPQPTPSNDIASENYRGPSAVSAAAGEGYIAHFLYAGIGLLAGGLATWMMPKTASKLVNGVRESLTKVANNEASLFKGPGKFFLGILGHGDHAPLNSGALAKFESEYQHGFGQWFLNHIPGGKALTKHLDGDRLAISVTTGGLLAAVGFFIVPAFLAKKGAQKGIEGKRQFERAKEELIKERGHNQVLKRYVNTLEGQVVELENGQKPVDQPATGNDEPQANQQPTTQVNARVKEEPATGAPKAAAWGERLQQEAAATTEQAIA